jgi:hypothetical protein
MRTAILSMLAWVLGVSTLSAQTLREQVSSLFRFGSCGEPLCLSVSNIHGSHYVPSVVAGNSNLIDFVADAIGTSIASVPISAASGGAIFTFENGVPVRTAISSGPIFGERAETLGRRRSLIAANVSAFNFRSLRGTPTNDLTFRFFHEDVGKPGLGDPVFENDFLEVSTDVDVQLQITTLAGAMGITDRFDVGVSIPFVRAGVNGTSKARLVSMFGDASPHLFNGSVITASAATDGSASGIGDLSLRMKYNLASAGGPGFAVLGDVRLPTGDSENLLGAGSAAFRVLGIASSRYRDFSPHLNAGYLYRGGDQSRSAMVVNAGFDQLISQRATFALDFLSEWQVGDNAVDLPAPGHFTVPFDYTLAASNISSQKDHIVNAAIGAKILTGRQFTVVVNSVIPLNSGGLRPAAGWTLGLERNF